MDYLTFNSFISVPVFISLYYFGAVVIPVMLWRYRHKLQKLFTIFQTLIANIAMLQKQSFFRSLSLGKELDQHCLLNH